MHTEQSTVRALLSPKSVARFLLALPFFHTVYDDPTLLGDGAQRAIQCTLLTYFAEALNTEYLGFIRTQRKIGCDNRKTNTRPELGRNEESVTTQLSQTGIGSNGHTKDAIISIHMGPGIIPPSANRLREDPSDLRCFKILHRCFANNRATRRMPNHFKIHFHGDGNGLLMIQMDRRAPYPRRPSDMTVYVGRIQPRRPDKIRSEIPRESLHASSPFLRRRLNRSVF